MSLAENVAYLESICKTANDDSAEYHIAAAALNEAGDLIGIATNEVRAALADEGKGEK